MKIKMKLKRETIIELGEILKDEFKLQLDDKNIEKVAYCLVGYFSLLLKIQTKGGVQK